jgi:hypothetical protein
MALEQELDKSMTLYGYEQGRPGTVPAVQPHRAPKVKDPAVTEMNFDSGARSVTPLEFKGDGIWESHVKKKGEHHSGYGAVIPF